MATGTLTDAMAAAERCLTLAEQEADPVKSQRFIEIAHAWLAVARQRSLS